MDYQRIYNQLIQKRKQILVEGYTEKHHIIPRCLGGTDDPENLVRLSAREHFIAHVLLVKIYPENRKLIHAASRMTYSKKFNIKIDSKTYDWLRDLRYKTPLPEEIRKKLSNANKGKKHTEETKKKMSEKLKGMIKKPFKKRLCPYCNKFYLPGNYGRYHGEKCKSNI